MQRAAVSERTIAAARPPRRAGWLAPAAFAAVLVAYNNLLFALPGELAFPPDWLFYPRAVLLPLAAVIWALRFHGLSLSDLGLTRRNLGAGAAIGLAAAVAISVPAVLYFLFPIGVSGSSIDYENFANDSVGEFAFWAAVRYPVHAAVFEEVLFRGVLLALALRSFGVTGGTVFSAAAFAAWHVAVDYDTMADSNVADNAAFFALAQAGALVALFVGGLAFALMRRRTGSLAGPIVFHWLAVVAMNATLFAQSR
jgi:membrane protease YdiL (CAAX protease family)